MRKEPFFSFHCFQIVASKLLRPALKDSISLEEIIQIHYRANSIINEIFDQPNNDFFPWVQYYLVNFRKILISAFENGTQQYKPVCFEFPGVGINVRNNNN